MRPGGRTSSKTTVGLPLKGESWDGGCCPKLGTEHSPTQAFEWVTTRPLSCDNILSTRAEAVQGRPLVGVTPNTKGRRLMAQASAQRAGHWGSSHWALQEGSRRKKP